MHDGWGYVLATYGLVVVTLAIWFWMIVGKLARSKATVTPNAPLPATSDETRDASDRSGAHAGE
jgi:hypothetical protein